MLGFALEQCSACARNRAWVHAGIGDRLEPDGTGNWLISIINFCPEPIRPPAHRAPWRRAVDRLCERMECAALVWMEAVQQRRDGICLPTVGAGASSHRRHRPEDTGLSSVVEQHADAFFKEHGERKSGLARLIREEFEAYLRCGRLEHSFIRVKCTDCRHEHRVAFSCKRCGWCASRRMA